MTDNAQGRCRQAMADALRSIIREAASARSALCEHELLIRLDNILAVARAALDAEESAGDGTSPVNP